MVLSCHLDQFFLLLCPRPSPFLPGSPRASCTGCVAQTPVCWIGTRRQRTEKASWVVFSPPPPQLDHTSCPEPKPWVVPHPEFLLAWNVRPCSLHLPFQTQEGRELLQLQHAPVAPVCLVFLSSTFKNLHGMFIVECFQRQVQPVHSQITCLWRLWNNVSFRIDWTRLQ